MKRIAKTLTLLVALLLVAISVKIATLGDKVDLPQLQTFVFQNNLKNKQGVGLKYFGTSCFTFTYNGETYLTDPFYSNPNIGQLISGKYDDRSDLIDGFMNDISNINMVSISHGHYDHCMDITSFEDKYSDSLKILTSQSTLYELNAEIKQHPHWQKVAIDEKNQGWIYSPNGNFRVHPIEGFHQPHFGHYVLASGHYDKPLVKLPAPVWEWKEGGTYSTLLDVLNHGEIVARYFLFSGGLTDYGKQQLLEFSKERHVDLFFAAFFDKRHTEHPLDELYHLLEPEAIIIHHWNDFFSSPYKEVRKLRNSKIEEVLMEKSQKGYPVSIMMPFTETKL